MKLVRLENLVVTPVFFSYITSINHSFLILQASNILFVDQPTGTGFSYTSDDSDIRHDETGVSNDLYDFLQVKRKLI